MVPRLLSVQRRPAAAALATLALGQVALMATFASQIGMLAGQTFSAELLWFPAGLALAAGGAIAAERWMAERFAQSFVVDCRAALFESAIRHRGGGSEARWLTGLVGDLTALRNYAVRGSVKLATATIAGFAALAWLVLAYPDIKAAALPLLLGLLLLAPVAAILSQTIVAQREERGRLTRFLIRRVRIELSNVPTPNGHGRRKLQTLSDALARSAVRRAALVGAMEAIAIAAGMASLLIVISAAGAASTGTVLASFALIGFVAARLLEGVRALHARIGGAIALERLHRLIDRPVRHGSAMGREASDA